MSVVQTLLGAINNLIVRQYDMRLEAIQSDNDLSTVYKVIDNINGNIVSGNSKEIKLLYGEKRFDNPSNIDETVESVQISGIYVFVEKAIMRLESLRQTEEQRK